jgi:hypothetical protein
MVLILMIAPPWGTGWVMRQWPVSRPEAADIVPAKNGWHFKMLEFEAENGAENFSKKRS